MLAVKDVRLIIPVTSPGPMVVAFAPIVRILIAAPSHKSILPFVAEGFALCILRTPFTVKSLLAVIPPVPLIVKLFISPVKTEAGSIIGEVLVKARVEPALPALIKPLVLAGELPAIVNMLAPRLKVPEDKSS